MIFFRPDRVRGRHQLGRGRPSSRADAVSHDDSRPEGSRSRYPALSSCTVLKLSSHGFALTICDATCVCPTENVHAHHVFVLRGIALQESWLRIGRDVATSLGLNGFVRKVSVHLTNEGREAVLQTIEASSVGILERKSSLRLMTRPTAAFDSRPVS